jgi:hypothetical protein
VGAPVERACQPIAADAGMDGYKSLNFELPDLDVDSQIVIVALYQIVIVDAMVFFHVRRRKENTFTKCIICKA